MPPARRRDVESTVGVDGERRFGLGFGAIHRVVRGAVEDDIRFPRRDDGFDRRRISDGNLLMREAGVPPKETNQLCAELTGCSENDCLQRASA